MVDDVIPPQRAAERGPRYWRTYRRKLGEGFDLAGKALTATAGTAMVTPLATRGTVTFPSLAVGTILAFGLLLFLLGIHLQAQAKPDD